ncbi:FkbM family methyltransferase [uncultured Flavobacterium sp.]|uniref:FkbM family methyltransferase n=1 Tax=uncultured Flavobacterium sp. TaxID=165435 RepID=UPI0030EEAA61
MEKRKNLIYDVGMHKGEDTEYYLKKGFEVIAFEANPELVNLCKQKFKKELESKQLTIVEGAIIDPEFDQDKDNPNILFYKNKNLSVWGTVDSEWAKRNEKRGTENEIIEVTKIDFKKCLEKFGIPYYLKIDIEGMDRVCLKALFHFDVKPDYVSIESEKVSFKVLKGEFDLFKNNGYSQFKIVNQGNIKEQKEPLNSEEGSFLDYSFNSGATGLFGKDLQQPWKGYKTAINSYRFIFLGYKLLGDNGVVTNRFLRKITLKAARFFTKESVPGWYDTHAKHSSVA